MIQDSEEYSRELSKVHKRASRVLLNACLLNSGLYIKMGQGLLTMNHILPKEYLDTLVVLQDQALKRAAHEVSN